MILAAYFELVIYLCPCEKCKQDLWLYFSTYPLFATYVKVRFVEYETKRCHVKSLCNVPRVTIGLLPASLINAVLAQAVNLIRLGCLVGLTVMPSSFLFSDYKLKRAQGNVLTKLFKFLHNFLPDLPAVLLGLPDSACSLRFSNKHQML